VEQRTQSMHANSVGESMSDTYDYKNPLNLVRLQSRKLAYCECVCVYVRVCMCQSVSVGKTLSGVYVCVFIRVRRVFWCVFWGVRLRIDVCVSRNNEEFL